MLSILAAILMQAATLADPGAAAPPGVHTFPDWYQFPSGADVAHFFPTEAARAGIEGVVRMTCRVTLEGKAADCVVEQEEPAGYRFGAAALQMSSTFKLRPATRNGIPYGEGILHIPVTFYLSDARLEPIAATYPGIAGHAEVHCRASGKRLLEGCIVARKGNADRLADLALQVAAKVTLPASTSVGLRIVVPVDIAPPAAVPVEPTTH